METPLFSIIVPFYNRSNLLADCLQAIFSSNCRDFEVIAVDDNSSDNSAEIAKGFPLRLISLKENIGQGRCRNRGAGAARGRILVFIDSDVIIPGDALSLVQEDFKNQPQISAVQGIYSDESRYRNFVSRYSNLHYHYYGRQVKKEYISSAATYFLAVSGDVFRQVGGFDENTETARLVGEDQVFGHRLNQKGYKIYFDKRIRVEHRKHYTLGTYLMHDIQTGHGQVRRFLRGNMRNLWECIRKKEVGAIIPAGFIYSVVLAFCIFLTILLYPLVSADWLKYLLITESGVFCLLNRGFFLFILRKQGIIFLLPSLILTYLKMLFAGFGCIKGFNNIGLSI